MAAAHHFQSESFTATKWSTAEQKAKFANQLMTFIAADFPENKFTKALYNRLSQCFGMIAHYNREGFIDTFFTDLPGKLRFLKCLTQWPCYGSPEYTFSASRPQRPRRFGRWDTWISTMAGYVASPRRAREPYWHSFRPSTTGQKRRLP
jgi:hypothetical protein